MGNTYSWRNCVSIDRIAPENVYGISTEIINCKKQA